MTQPSEKMENKPVAPSANYAKAAHLMEWAKQLAPLDDRAVVIVISAYLEDRLTDLISAAFVDISSAQLVLQDDRCCSTFSAKLRLARAMGIISIEFAADLDSVRKLRNNAAHSAAAFKLSTPPAIDHLDRLFHKGRAKRTSRKHWRRLLSAWSLYAGLHLLLLQKSVEWECKLRKQSGLGLSQAELEDCRERAANAFARKT